MKSYKITKETIMTDNLTAEVEHDYYCIDDYSDQIHETSTVKLNKTLTVSKNNYMELISELNNLFSKYHDLYKKEEMDLIKKARGE